MSKNGYLSKNSEMRIKWLYRNIETLDNGMMPTNICSCPMFKSKAYNVTCKINPEKAFLKKKNYQAFTV